VPSVAAGGARRFDSDQLCRPLQVHLIRVKQGQGAARRLGAMPQPRVFLAYAPRGVGLRCALAYLASDRDVYGWFTGPAHGERASLYFVVEDFYSKSGGRYVAAQTLDLHTGWILDEQRCHELAALQEAFVAEWLFQRDDPDATGELGAMRHAQLAASDVNVRYEKLGRFSKLQPNWTYYSKDFERPLLNFLAKRWPLEYRPDREP
jgi:hypothetical protein